MDLTSILNNVIDKVKNEDLVTEVENIKVQHPVIKVKSGTQIIEEKIEKYQQENTNSIVKFKAVSSTTPIIPTSPDIQFAEVGFVCANTNQLIKGKTAVVILNYVYDNFEVDSYGLVLPELGRYNNKCRLQLTFGELKENFENKNGKVIKRKVIVANERESQDDKGMNSTYQSGFKSLCKFSVLDHKNITHIRVLIPQIEDLDKRKKKASEKLNREGSYYNSFLNPTKHKGQKATTHGIQDYRKNNGDETFQPVETDRAGYGRPFNLFGKNVRLHLNTNGIITLAGFGIIAKISGHYVANLQDKNTIQTSWSFASNSKIPNSWKAILLSHIKSLLSDNGNRVLECTRRFERLAHLELIGDAYLTKPEIKTKKAKKIANTTTDKELIIIPSKKAAKRKNK